MSLNEEEVSIFLLWTRLVSLPAYFQKGNEFQVLFIFPCVFFFRVNKIHQTRVCRPTSLGEGLGAPTGAQQMRDNLNSVWSFLFSFSCVLNRNYLRLFLFLKNAHKYRNIK